LTAYPLKSWAVYEAELKLLGERRTQGHQDPFLTALGLIDAHGNMTQSGAKYFELKFIQRNDEEALQLLGEILLNLPPVTAICQLLDGVAGATRTNAETVLRSQGFGDDLTDRKLGSLLTLMRACGLIATRRDLIHVVASPAKLEKVPASVFISRQTPFGNKVWLRRILEECEGFIYWIDKHFMPMAFRTAVGGG